MLHQMKLQDRPFSQIQKGKKTIELRLYDEKRQKVKVGDRIEFTNLQEPGKKLLTQVTALHLFDSFAEMFRVLPKSQMGYEPAESPKAEDMEAYYSKEEQALYGVVGIELTRIDLHDPE